MLLLEIPSPSKKNHTVTDCVFGKAGEILTQFPIMAQLTMFFSFLNLVEKQRVHNCCV